MVGAAANYATPTGFEANAPYSIGDYSVSFVEKRGGEATVRAVVLVDSAAGEGSYPIAQRLVREDGSGS